MRWDGLGGTATPTASTTPTEGVVEVLPVRRSATSSPPSEDGLDWVTGGALMPNVQLALTARHPAFDAAWVELSPLLRGETAFTLAHPRPAAGSAGAASARGAFGFSMPPAPPKEEDGDAAADASAAEGDTCVAADSDDCE